MCASPAASPPKVAVARQRHPSLVRDSSDDDDGEGSGEDDDLNPDGESSDPEGDGVQMRRRASALEPVPVITPQLLLEKWRVIAKGDKIKGSDSHIESQLTIPMCNGFDITPFL
jgi:hypothetical protein